MGIRIGHFAHKGATQWGVVREDAIFPLLQTYPTLRSLLEQPDLSAQVETAVSASSSIPLNDVHWLSPVTREAQIVCQGVNYAAHRQEGGYSAAKPSFNLIFSKASSSICGPIDDVIRPKHVQLLDYEIELGIVIGKPILQPTLITRDNLHDYVAGIVITNDISARDVQIPQEQWLKGKSYRTFCPVGPYLYLLEADEMASLDDLELKLWVNGNLRQSANTGQMLYKPAETLAELSGVMDLFPGDLLMTGTPSGVALKAPAPIVRKVAGLLLSQEQRMDTFIRRQLENSNYLQDGDVIRATIQSPSGHIDLGAQENKVVPGSSLRT